MATAGALRATYTVDERVRGVAGQVVGIDNRLRDVNDTVKAVDDKVAGAVTDAQAIKRQSSPSYIGLSFESHATL